MPRNAGGRDPRPPPSPVHRLRKGLVFSAPWVALLFGVLPGRSRPPQPPVVTFKDEPPIRQDGRRDQRLLARNLARRPLPWAHETVLAGDDDLTRTDFYDWCVPFVAHALANPPLNSLAAANLRDDLAREICDDAWHLAARRRAHIRDALRHRDRPKRKPPSTDPVIS